MKLLNNVNASLGEGWTTRLEEALLRFDDNGLAAAHVTTCSKKPVEGSDPVVRISKPIPFATTPESVAELFGEAVQKATAVIAEREATIVERDATIKDLQQQLATMTADRDAQGATIDKLTDAYSKLSEAITAKDAETEALTTANKEASTTIESLTKQLAESMARCASMEAHPDVIAAKKEAAITAAKAKIAEAEAAKKVLADLGEPVQEAANTANLVDRV